MSSPLSFRRGTAHRRKKTSYIRRAFFLFFGGLGLWLIINPLLLLRISTFTDLESPPAHKNVSLGTGPLLLGKTTLDYHEDSAFHFHQEDGSAVDKVASKSIFESAKQIARAFPDRIEQNWCTPPSHRQDKWRSDEQTGILLVKVPKSASSTLAGIALRIGNRMTCDVAWQHRTALSYANRDTQRSFLFTSIRDPSTRAVSSIFFHMVSRTESGANNEMILSNLAHNADPHYGAISPGQGGFSVQYTTLAEIEQFSAWSTDKPDRVLNQAAIQQHVKRIIDGYDFLVVVERMDESLVAMAMIMGIEVGDVLVTSSKVGGSSYHFGVSEKQERVCVPTAKAFITPTVKDFLESDVWLAMNYGDYLLHEAASQSLDLTIDRLGREHFERELAEYRRLRKMEAEQCAPFVQFPCTSDGVPQTHVSKRTCYLQFHDFGCGYRCIDDMIAKDKANGAISQKR